MRLKISVFVFHHHAFRDLDRQLVAVNTQVCIASDT